MLRAIPTILLLWALAFANPLLAAGAPLAAPAAAQQDGSAGPTRAELGAGDGTADDERFAAEPAPIVRSFEVIGGERLDPDRLRDALGLAIGAPYDAERVRRGIETLWTRGLRSELASLEVEGGIALRLRVTEMPLDLTPRFVGNEREDRLQVLEWAGLRDGQEVRVNQTYAIAQRIQASYLREGYAFVEVEPVLGELVLGDTARPATQDVIFQIAEGPRVFVDDVIYTGNTSLPNRGWGPWRSGLIHEARPVSRNPTFEWLFGGLFAKPFREESLKEDLVAMRQAYRDLGYLDAVVEVDHLEFSKNRRWVTIHVRVDEGEPYRVRSLRIEGFQRQPDPNDPRLSLDVPTELIVPEDELLALCDLAPGDVLTQFEIELDQRDIVRRYGDIGHIAHGSMPFYERFEFLEPQLVFDAEENVVDVVYRLAQGAPQYIREIQIEGNTRTRDRVIRREFADLFEGGRADLAKIERGIARLRGSGYFSMVGPASAGHREPTFRFVETSDSRWKDLVVTVEEGSQIRFDFGVEWSPDSGLAGRIGVTFQNFDISRWPSWEHPWDDVRSGRAFRGAGQTLRLFASPGTDFSRYQVSFTEPDLFGRHLDRIGSTVRFSRNFLGFRTHQEERDEFALSFFKQLDADTRLSLGYRTSAIQVDELTPGTASILDPLGVPDLLAQQVGESRVSGAELSLSRRIFDNALDPRDGYSASASLFVSDSAFASDFDFASLEGTGTLTGSFYEEPGVKPVYRLSLLAAAMVPYGDTDDVPYTERQFLGGSRRMRGFNFRGVGPNQRQNPIGGETMLYGSVEYLWPLVTQPIAGTTRELEVFRGGFFVDAGILDPDSFELDLGEYRLSAGFTVGMIQPLPLALNFGFPLVRREGDRRRTFSFTLSTN
ncbi:Outer membrane protein assembly factor BamA precursor [Planctomycetes bacterium Pla163]|uniref:Outer membrane protein assembly factor BamA n=1 Tax=Rohdeia mirabilis TaxID=2528008 RepID=A0A518D2Y8_9BACT|nr:Outer membrane protein assembly factor BamA precursor [Planctomycetes bacterium Pla163]